jgi:energy-coupling factor transporter ATP-binding protein EcfA2
MADTTILLVGPTGSGKSTQLGELAEIVSKQTSGQKHLRLYTADPGGYRSLKPHINLGLIQVVELKATNPWAYEWACDGMLPDPTGEHKKWILDAEANANVGGWAFEGLTSFGNGLMGNLAARAALGDNVGGEKVIIVPGNSSSSIGPKGADGITVGGNNRSHYGIVQGRLRELVYRTHRLPGIVIWTALDSAGEDKEGMQRVVGARVAGKALIDEVPAWFTYTLHMVVNVDDGERPRHRMYLMHHRDESTPGALALANTRQPLGLDQPLPPYVEPASVKRVFELIEGAEAEATEKLKASLGL